MPEAVAPVAPTPTNGAAAKQAPTVPAPTSDVATGPQGSAQPGQPRGPDGKFAPKEGVAAAPTEAERRKLRIKDLELDEDAAYAEIQRARQASRLLTESQKRQEAAERREKEFEAKRAKAREDLSVLLDELGLTPEQEKAVLSKAIYRRHLEQEQLTPEQRRIRELEEYQAKTESEKQQEAEKQRAAVAKAAEEEAFRQVEEEINLAIEEGKLPKSRPLIRAVAQWMSRAEDISPTEALALAKQDIANDFAEVARETELSTLKEMMGEKPFDAFVLKVVQYAMAKVGSQQQPAAPRAPRQVAQPPKQQRLTPQQWMHLQRKGR